MVLGTVIPVTFCLCCCLYFVVPHIVARFSKDSQNEVVKGDPAQLGKDEKGAHADIIMDMRAPHTPILHRMDVDQRSVAPSAEPSDGGVVSEPVAPMMPAVSVVVVGK